VLAVLRQESEKRRRRTRIIRGCVMGLIGFQLTTAIFLAFRGKFEFTDLATTLLPLILIGGIAAGFSPQEKNALVAALPESDPRLIGYLCEALGSGDADLVAVARERLETLFAMPNLEYEGLSAEQQAALTLSMVTAPESFQLVALTGLARVGNKEAILTLEQYSADKSPKVAAEALRLVPDLRMRLARGIIDGELRRTQPRVESQRETDSESISTKPD